jgi:hypothetical protein
MSQKERSNPKKARLSQDLGTSAELRSVCRSPGADPRKPVNNFELKTKKREELWAMGKWKSKIRIPTFPPPRMPAAQGKNGRLHKTLDTSVGTAAPFEAGLRD